MSIDFISIGSNVSLSVERDRETVLNGVVVRNYKDKRILTSDLDNYQKNQVINEFTEFIKDSTTANNIDRDSGILPPGVLFVSDSFIVFERQPDVKTIFIIPKLVDEFRQSDSEQIYTYQIAIPWQLYIVQYGKTTDPSGQELFYPCNVRMHFMKNNLTHLDQEVYMAPLPNFYANGTLCRPMFDSMDEFSRYPNNISGVIQAAYDWIWNSGTNLDLTICPASMYIQFAHNYNYVPDASNTLWRGNHVQEVPFDSFYISWSYVVRLFEAWEKVSLDEVINLDWPSNYTSFTWREELDRHNLEHQEEYANYVTRQVNYEMHYDEESDEEYQCEYDSSLSPEEQCYCLQPLYSEYSSISSTSNYYMDTGLIPLKPKTYRETYENFVKQVSIPGQQNGVLSAQSVYNNFALKIIHSI